MRTLFFCVLATFIAITDTQNVQAQVGITAVPFLSIEPDSRAAGMGNTGVALADNASAVFWNPAGLADQRNSQVSITHSKWLPDFNADLFYDYLVGEHHVDGVGTFGGHITYLNLGDQKRTTLQNPNGDGLGRFNSYELSVGVSYGFRINEHWALGTGARFIYSSLFNGDLGTGNRSVSPGSSVGFDLSSLYTTSPFTFIGNDASFQAGLNISNIGPGLHYTNDSAKDPLPTELRFGWAFTTYLDQNNVHKLTLANDISKIMARDSTTGVSAIIDSWNNYTQRTGQGPANLSVAQQFMVGTGLEYWYNELFALRTGYYFEDPNNGNRRFLTLGAGIKYDFVGVNFSYVYSLEDNQPLSNTTRFSLLLNF